MIHRLRTALLFLALGALTVPPAGAQDAKPAAAADPAAEAATAEKPAPYDEQLGRLSEILGSVHYLRALCGASATDDWRSSMQKLLDIDTGDEPKRREKLTAAFNRGYRSFASVYSDCTAAAVVAEERYRIEGATLAAEIAARFGN